MISASRAFPLGLGRQAELSAGACAKPLAVADCLVPRHSGYGLLGMVEGGVAPERRWGQRRDVVQEAPVVGVGDLTGGEQKLVNPDAVYGLLVVLSSVAAHEERSRGG